MSDVIRFPARCDLPDRYGDNTMFGGCPICHGVDNIWNVGRDHWSVCHRHKTKWNLGSNIFSSWRDESEEVWLKNEYRLANYRTVEPYFDPRWIDPEWLAWMGAP